MASGRTHRRRTRATKEQIRSKYREQALQVHPDKPGGDDARFKAIQEAYATLSNDTKRQQYEDSRAAWLAARDLLGCPSCGTALRKYPVEGVGTRCAACKTPLTTWSATGRLRVLPFKVFSNPADYAEVQAVDMVEVAMDQAEELASRVQEQLLAWLGVRLGIKSPGSSGQNKAGT